MKYLKSTFLVCKDIGVRKSEFDAKTPLFTIFDRWSRKVNAITRSCLLIAVISVNHFKIWVLLLSNKNHRVVKSKISRYTNFEMVIFLSLLVSFFGQVLFVKASSNIFCHFQFTLLSGYNTDLFILIIISQKSRWTCNFLR